MTMELGEQMRISQLDSVVCSGALLLQRTNYPRSHPTSKDY